MGSRQEVTSYSVKETIFVNSLVVQWLDWDLHSWGPSLMLGQGTKILQKKKKKMKFLNSKERGAGVTSSGF